jgi:hypothetical protein
MVLPKSIKSLDELATLINDGFNGHTELVNQKFDSLKMILDDHTKTLDNLTKDIADLKADKASRHKTIKRLEYRTEKILGKKLEKVDAQFEDQYQGEANYRKAEAEG